MIRLTRREEAANNCFGHHYEGHRCRGPSGRYRYGSFARCGITRATAASYSVASRLVIAPPHRRTNSVQINRYLAIFPSASRHGSSTQKRCIVCFFRYTVPMKQDSALPIIAFATSHEWEEWLDAHHQDDAGVWLKIAKKGSEVPSVSYADALDVALCYGWIDGQKAAADTGYWLQKFTPRRARSLWSRVNREKALALIAAGRMRALGMQQVERAQRDGRWDNAYASPSTITVPDDFQQALDQNPEAQAFFGTLNSANRYAILWRIETAKKQETRAARIEQFITMLKKGESLHP